MSDQVLTERPPNPNFLTEESLDSLDIPLDTLYFDGDPDFAADFAFNDVDNCDFDFNFDGIDDFCLPNEKDTCFEPVVPAVDSGQSQPDPDWLIKPDCGFTSDRNSGNLEGNGGRRSDVGKFLNCLPSEAESCHSGDGSSDSVRVLNSHSPIESRRTGDVSSGLSGTRNAPSPDSDNCIVDQKVKAEVLKTVGPKRKNDCGNESRNNKLRRSENEKLGSGGGIDGGSEGLVEEDEKRKTRLIRNRESAQLSRQRKKQYVDELEEKVRAMHTTIAELNGKISYFMAENVSLRQQLISNGNGVCPPPVYPPMGAVAYPWMMPCPPYVVKSQGSQVPLVPIPKLKPQPPVSAAKDKNSQSEKRKVKAKKVASVSLLGFLFFIVLFGCFVPTVRIKESSVSLLAGFGGDSERFHDEHRERVLTVHGHTNSSLEDLSVGKTEGINGSEPLVASLFVPRNDKLIKIDGNLIIQSVLASERAMAPFEPSKSNNHEDTALAIPEIGNNGRKNSHLFHGADGQQRALPAGSADSLKDHLRVSAANGKMPQWFHGGIAGPMLSSGMCTEVFQFDISPGPGAIIPASSVTNITAENKQNRSRTHKGKNRRILHSVPTSLAESDLNITSEHVGRDSPKDNDLRSNKSVSPMIVSVLVDPREAGDGGKDGVISPKSISQIFVVVLRDSVKYVTYSCMLPRIAPHLVTS